MTTMESISRSDYYRQIFTVLIDSIDIKSLCISRVYNNDDEKLYYPINY